jgi:hypothetical protein
MSKGSKPPSRRVERSAALLADVDAKAAQHSWLEREVLHRIDSARRLILALVVAVLVGLVIAPAQRKLVDWNTFSKLVDAAMQSPRFAFSASVHRTMMKSDAHKVLRVSYRLIDDGVERSISQNLIAPSMFAAIHPFTFSMGPVDSVTRGHWDSLSGLSAFWERSKMASCWYVAEPDIASGKLVVPADTALLVQGSLAFEYVSAATLRAEARAPGAEYSGQVLDTFDCTQRSLSASAIEAYCIAHEKGTNYVLSAQLYGVGQVAFAVEPARCPRGTSFLDEAMLAENGMDPGQSPSFRDVLGASHEDILLVDSLMDVVGLSRTGSDRQKRGYKEITKAVSDIRTRLAEERESTQLGGVEMSIQSARRVYPWFLLVLCVAFLLTTEALRWRWVGLQGKHRDEPIHQLVVRFALLVILAGMCGFVGFRSSPDEWMAALGIASGIAVALPAFRSWFLLKWLF